MCGGGGGGGGSGSGESLALQRESLALSKEQFAETKDNGENPLLGKNKKLLSKRQLL